jgi:hypothetical protein
MKAWPVSSSTNWETSQPHCSCQAERDPDLAALASDLNAWIGDLLRAH